MSSTSPRILVTGSADGLGLAAARDLIADGATVIGHARSQARANALRSALPQLAEVVVADFSSLDQVRGMAAHLAESGPLTAIIHNAGVGYREAKKVTTKDGHAHVLQINVLAPYLLTALLPKPERLVWLSSGLNRDGEPSLDDVDWNSRRWNGYQAYSDSKLFDGTLAMAFARIWPTVASNALEPGWVATKMGGAGAPDDLTLAHVTQVWLAEATDSAASGTGGYFYHQAPAAANGAMWDQEFQDALLAECARLTGTPIPE
jgi:NAD(P)-dependent dehydrogenase (short-subunit alcohol dehydrogenase family)